MFSYNYKSRCGNYKYFSSKLAVVVRRPPTVSNSLSYHKNHSKIGMCRWSIVDHGLVTFDLR